MLKVTGLDDWIDGFGRLALAGPPTAVPMEAYGEAFFQSSQGTVSSRAHPHTATYDPTDTLLGSCHGPDYIHPVPGVVEVILTYDTDYAATEHDRGDEHGWLQVASNHTQHLLLAAMYESFERVRWR